MWLRNTGVHLSCNIISHQVALQPVSISPLMVAVMK